MTTQEMVKRNNKSRNLSVIQLEEGDHFVSSEDGLILYKVTNGNGEGSSCTCGDFARGFKTDPQFKCKHILALMNCGHDFEKGRFLDKAQPKLDPRFIVQIDGQDFAKFSGLLDLAHQKRLTSLETEIIQYPTQENEKTAICKAHAKTAFGESFMDVGDANPMNCNSKVSRHLIRMASTRAKARALRDLTNIGMTSLEELGDLDDVLSNEEKGTAQRGKVKPFPKKIVKDEAAASHSDNGNGKGTRSTGPVQDAGSPGSKEVKEPEKNDKKTSTDNQPQAKASEKSGDNGKGKTKDETPPKMSEAQHRALMNLSRRRGISVEELEKLSQETYGVSVESLNAGAASQFIRTLQQSA